MEITELRQTKNDRYALTLDSGERFTVTLNDVADFSLYTGRELTEDELDALRGAAALSRCKERAMRIIGARAMSERELYDRLVEKGETEQNAAATLAWLIGLHVLNDEDYAAMLVRHYSAKGYGARRIRDELYRRKVPRELWDGALAEQPAQDDAIDRLLRSRLRGAEPGDRAAMKRASDALLRRGFGWEEVKEAIERYQSE
ncbi:MAG: regulatory protein RecX [Oscillospiraceae bacterium]|nr:regulatory protein RecX [Oscillospiraceae bacterium]